jgi:MFS family permease
MTYISEVRSNARYLVAASLGLGVGYAVNMYITSIFSPHLMAEFGWTKAQFALLGVTIVIGTVMMPIAGRITDVLGVRVIAACGIVANPLVYLGFSTATEDFRYFAALTVAQVVLVGATTSSVVYTRLVAENFDRARGLALSLVACSPAAVAAIMAPLLNVLIEAHGWRTGYLALAATSAVAGAIVLMLLARTPAGRAGGRRARARGTAEDYLAILRNRAFAIIAAGILLCNLTHTVIGAQLKLILLDQGVASGTAAAMVSLFAMGVVAGRFLCGLALDRFAPQFVAAAMLALPSVGLGVLAAHPQDSGLIGTAVLLIGLSTGAELDVVAYLIMRFFPLEVYGTTYGLVTALIALSSASGALLLGLALQQTGRFDSYLQMTALTTLLGGLLFLLLPARLPANPSVEAAG